MQAKTKTRKESGTRLTNRNSTEALVQLEPEIETVVAEVPPVRLSIMQAKMATKPSKTPILCETRLIIIFCAKMSIIRLRYSPLSNLTMLPHFYSTLATHIIFFSRSFFITVRQEVPRM